MRTFGMDEPMGCYDDIEQADAFVLWGSNMAEMHPILWSRITNRRLTDQNVKVRFFLPLNTAALSWPITRLSSPRSLTCDPELHRKLHYSE